MTFRKLLPPCLALLFGFGAVATAQETPTPKTTQPNQTMDPQRVGRGPHRRQMRMRRQRLGIGRALNLSDEQKKLGQSIRQKYFASMKTQREQLFQLREKRLAGTFTPEDKERVKALRQEMRTARRGMREESLGVLTPEQRTQIDSFREQRKLRREERMQRRLELRQNKPLD